MSGERDFLAKEVVQIGKTLDLIEPLLAKPALDQYESIALGTQLQNVYMGIENILRCQLELRRVKLVKSDNWHKDLLQAALSNAIIEPAEHPVFRDLLLYRHRHVHGYGHMLEEARLRDLAGPVPAACRAYLRRLSTLDS